MAGDDPFGTGCGTRWTSWGPLCVGIDPHPGLLDHWGLPDTVAGLETFALTCVEAFGGSGGRGQAAVGVLRAVRVGGRGRARAHPRRRCATPAPCRSSTSSAATSARRWPATRRPTSPTARPLRADAITVSPYLGYESLRPALDLAAGTGRGVFVLDPDLQPRGAVGAARRARGGHRRGIRRGGRRARQRRRRGIRAPRQRRDGRRRDGGQRGHRPRARPHRRRRSAARAGPRRPGRHARRPCAGPSAPRCPRCSARAAARCSSPARTSPPCATRRGGPPTTWPPPCRA